MPKEERHSLDKPKKYKIVISKDPLWDIKTKKAIKELDSYPKGYEATGYVIEGLSIYFKPYSTYFLNLLCRGRFHHYGNSGFKRPNVLAIHYKENAKNQQINLKEIITDFYFNLPVSVTL